MDDLVSECRWPRQVLACALCLAALLAGLPARAASLQMIPALTLREEYSDNIFFDATAEETDWLTTLTPALTLERLDERLQLQATARLAVLRYRDNADLDALDQQYLGKASFRWTPRLSLNGDVEYQRDSRPDRDLVENGLVLDAERRDRWRFGCGGGFALSERSSMGLTYSFQEIRYPQDPSADSDSHFLMLGYSYLLSERMQGLVNLSYAHSEYDGARTDNGVLEGGLAYALSESLNLQALVGIRHTRSRYEEVVPVVVFPFVFFVKQDAESSDEGWTARMSASWRDERSIVQLSLHREVRLASGRSGSTELSSLVVSGSHRLTDRLSLTFSGGYYLNQADSNEFGGEAIDERTLRLTPGLRYRWSEDLSLTLGYNHTRLDDREEDEVTSRNLVFICIDYQYPLEL
jgi:hypothetical protein